MNFFTEHWSSHHLKISTMKGVFQKKAIQLWLLQRVTGSSENKGKMDRAPAIPGEEAVAESVSNKENFNQLTVRTSVMKLRKDLEVNEIYKLEHLCSKEHSDVLIGTDKSTGEQFAIKALKDKYQDNNRRQKVCRETDILSGLQHKNVISLKEYFEQNGTVYLATEFLSGGELNDAIRERRYNEETARQIFSQILNGIKYLHEVGVVHRDIKIQNLLLAEDKTVKIIDFGYAKRVQEEPSTPCGSPLCSAPEVIQNLNVHETEWKEYTPAVDLWSAGVALYVLLGGYYPFQPMENESAKVATEEVLDSICKGAFSFEDPVWNVISQNAKDLICDLLNTEADERPSAEEALQHPWIKEAGAQEAPPLPTLTLERKTLLYDSRHASLEGSAESTWALGDSHYLIECKLM